jgi:hypothetical protein
MVLLINLFLAILIALAVTFESFGSLFRVLGALTNKQSIGYSMHVRVATIGRVFLIASAPMIGYLVDEGSNFKRIILICICCYLFLSIFHILIYINRIKIINFLLRYFCSYYNIKIIDNKIKDYELLRNRHISLIFFSGLVFLINLSAIFVVNILAILNPNLKSTILQSIGWITMIGTSIHIFFIDPILAHNADKNDFNAMIVSDYLCGRMHGSIVGFTLSVIIYCIIKYV